MDEASAPNGHVSFQRPRIGGSCFSQSNHRVCFLGGAADRLPDLVHRSERARASERGGRPWRRQLRLGFGLQRGGGGRVPTEPLGARGHSKSRGIRQKSGSLQECFTTRRAAGRCPARAFARRGLATLLLLQSGAAAADQQPPFVQSSSARRRCRL